MREMKKKLYYDFVRNWFRELRLDMDLWKTIDISSSGKRGTLRILTILEIPKGPPNQGWDAKDFKWENAILSWVNPVGLANKSGTWLESLRGFHGLSYGDVADKVTRPELEVHVATIRAIEFGQLGIDMELATMISGSLGVPLKVVFERKKNSLGVKEYEAVLMRGVE